LNTGHTHTFSVDSFQPNAEIVASYDSFFVALSVLIAIGASLLSFVLSARTDRSDFKNERYIWAVASACFLGFGIWAMHFVGMLAYQLPIAVSYNPLITFFSIIPAIFASLIVVSHHSRGRQKLWLRSLYMGGGIGSMHYVGMLAMEMHAVMAYDIYLFSLSIIVAVVLAGIALKAHSYIQGKQVSVTQQLIPATIMGCAISGMHYTGMLSMHVFAVSSTEISYDQSHKDLAYLVIFMVAFFAFVFVLLIELRARKLSSDRFTAVLNTVQEGVISFDDDGRLEFINPAALTMFGYDKKELQYRRINELVNHAKGENAVLLNEVIKAANSDVVRSRPQRIEGVRKDGSTFPLSFLVNRLPSDHEAFVCTVKDLSDVKNQEVFAQTVFDTFPDMMFVKDAETLAFTHANDMGARLIGIAKHELVGLTDFDIFESNDAKVIIESDVALLESGKNESCEEAKISIGGQQRCFQIKKVVIRCSNNKPQFILSLSEDVTELRKTQDTLESLNKRMSMAADAAHIGVWEWDLDTNELIWDDWMHKIYSIPKDDFNDHYSVWANTVHLDDFDDVKTQIDHAINTNSEFHAQFRVQVSRDNIRYVRADGRIQGNKMFGINIDITEQVMAEERIKELASQDTLTGLANRRALITYVEQEFSRIERTEMRCVCLYFDLNNFKPINDTYGHNIGDEVLVEIADRMKRLCRESDLAARVGGDEFIIILTDIDETFDLDGFIDRTNLAVSKPITTSIGTVAVGTSVGFASYPNEATNLDDLIRLADERMFEQKNLKEVSNR
jgi:diguanylate cyclase (GGDEF)-like protein/PAS domain S-box-containing protein